jgi:hypothetical protein
MTPEELDEIQARVDATPEGPWRTVSDGMDGTDWGPVIVSDAKGKTVAELPGSKAHREVVGNFIAHSRTDIPALLEEVRGNTRADCLALSRRLDAALADLDAMRGAWRDLLRRHPELLGETNLRASGEDEYVSLLAEVKRLRRALPEPEKLDLLADWLDRDDALKGRTSDPEVQRDLRRWARASCEALSQELGTQGGIEQ